MDNFHKLVNTLKCSFCSYPLSVPPVMTISKDGTKYRCGRCKDIKCTTTIRNTFLESVTELLTFPCIYANCPDEIPWKEVTAHEKKCEFKSIKCPVYYQNCQEMVRIDQLEDHMQKKHEQNIHYEKMVFNIIPICEYVCLLISHDIQFFIYYYKCSTTVFCLKPEIYKNFTYNVKLSNEVNKRSISFEDLYINDFNDKLHCSECIIKAKCTSNNHYPYKLTARKFHHHELSQSHMNHIKIILENPERITVTVDIIPKKEYLSENTTKSDECNSRNDCLRESFECPICLQYMIGPIYTCEKGHAICSECKLKIDICSCQANIGEARNFALEDIAEILTLPCVYGNNGCKFVGNLESVSKHEPNCSHN